MELQGTAATAHLPVQPALPEHSKARDVPEKPRSSRTARLRSFTLLICWKWRSTTKKKMQPKKAMMPMAMP